MKTVCFVTATRAEYGLLKNLIKVFLADREVETRVVATGTHLCKEFGYTLEEIKKDGIPLDAEIPIFEEGEACPTHVTISRAVERFGKYFSDRKPDLLVALGDRYEMLAICLAATSQNVPIAHLHGGEITKGAKDDAYRHCITKLSHLHFTSTTEYAKRVIQLGENPQRVFSVGALGVENCMKEDLLSEEQLKKELGILQDMPYAMVTFHPATLELSDATEQVKQLLSAMATQKDMFFVISKANADEQGQAINHVLEQYISDKMPGSERFLLRASLGVKRYLSGIKYSQFVLGNSSSGILEAPSFQVPTINIGSRQEGRIQAKSVINCPVVARDIEKAIELARSKEFKETLKNVKNPYGDGQTSARIHEIIKKSLKDGISLTKDFYDIN